MRIKTPIAFVFTCLLSGCVLNDVPRNSKYFGDYSEFQKVDFKAETSVYRHPTTRVIDYDKFYIAPVVVYDNPQKTIKERNRPFFDDLADELELKLSTLVSRNYKIVDGPGPGVLKLIYAVRDIKPHVWVSDPNGNRVLKSDTTMKGSKFELDCLDSLSDERIFAITTLYVGDEYKAYEDLSLIPNVQSAFDEWARFLGGLLEKAKDSKTAQVAADRGSFRPSTAAYITDPTNPAILIYRHPFLEVIDYKHFYLAQPVLQGPTKRTAAETKELALQLRNEAAKVFDNPSMLINHPGPDILTVRTIINETASNTKLSLECIDPNKGDLVFGMVKIFSHKDFKKIYQEWNADLKERWDIAKEDAQ